MRDESQRILIYGESWRGSMPFSILMAMTRLGYEAVVFDYQKYLSKLDGNRLLRKAARKLDKAFHQRRCKDINERFLKLIKDFKPHFVIVVKGHHMLPETIERINGMEIPVAHWHVDDPMNPRYLTTSAEESFKLYDIHFSSRPHLFKEYVKKGAKRVEYLEFFYDGTIFYPLDSLDDNKYEVSFIGNWSEYREKWIQNLSPFFEVHVWGGGWWRAHSVRNDKHIRLNGYRVNLEDYSRIVAHSKICLNFLTPENRDQTNLRNFELPACKGFQLCYRTNQIQSIFIEDEEICLFGTTEELKEKIAYYLQHNNERMAVSQKGFECVKEKEHSVISRCSQVASKIVQLSEGN